MTTRRPSSGRRAGGRTAGRRPLTFPGTFRLLPMFFRGYLHEDVEVEYGSALSAMDAFLADLSDAERRILGREAARARDIIETLGLAELREFLVGSLGGAWHAPSKKVVLELLSKAADR